MLCKSISSIIFSLTLLLVSISTIGCAFFDGDSGSSPSLSINALFYIGGWDSGFTNTQTVYRSLDSGVTWTEVGTNSFPTVISTCRAVYFNNQLWVVGGSDGATSDKVYSTSNGVDWTSHGSVLPGVTQEHALLEHNNKLYVIGGVVPGPTRFDTIWSSSDGITWADTGDTIPNPTADLSALSFNNKIWVLGGQATGAGTNGDVYSYDGTTVLDSTDTSVGDMPSVAEWSDAFVLNNTMFMLGGTFSANNNTIYSSATGASWVDESSTNGKWLPIGLSLKRVEVVNGKAIMAGGLDNTFTFRSEVYETSNGTDWSKIGDLPAARGEGCMAALPISADDI